MQENVAEMYLGAIDGWAEVAPKAAWEAFKERQGPLSKSLVIEDFEHSFHEVLSEQLAKADPDRVFHELSTFRSAEFEEMIVASMLGGYLRSAPRGREWRKEATRLLERDWRTNGWLHAEIRTALMGRWLQDDAKSAEKWFDESDLEGLNWSYRDETKKVKIRKDLGTAAGYWAARDFPAAWRWMKSYKGFKREGFGAAVLQGAAISLTRGSSYFHAGDSARPFLLEQAAKLPDALDRQTCITMLKEANTDTRFLDGVPEMEEKSMPESEGQPR